MTFSLGLVLYIFAVQAFGFVIKGLVGFGNPLISGPLLSMRMDNAVITPGNLMMDAPVNAYIAWKNRKNFNPKRVLPILIACMAGVVPGTLLLKFSMPWIIKVALGVLVVIIGVEMATRSKRKVTEGKENAVIRTLVAFVSGVCAGLFGINMLIIAYLERTAKEHDEFKGSLCFLFLIENIFRLCNYLIIGIVTKEALLLFACTIPAAIVGMAISNVLAPRLPEKAVKRGVVAMFLLGGISIIIKAAIFHT